jgi:hypothetical protein
MSRKPEPKWRAGGCHCGAVRFEAALPDEVEAHDCNCSICAMTAFIHIIVPESRFRLLAGLDRLAEYRFNTGAARHLFCSVCGVKAFYRPRSNPDGWSVNAHCLDAPEALSLTVTAFDGRDWEHHGAALAHLSLEAR